MAKRLNKKLMAGMTFVGMFVTILAAVFVIVKLLPKQDPQPAVENAVRAAKLATLDGYKEAARQYNTAATRAKALADSSSGEEKAKYEEDSKRYRLLSGDMALKAGDPRTAIELWKKVILVDLKSDQAYERILDVYLDGRADWKQIEETAADLCNKANKDNLAGLRAWGLALVNQPLARKENLAEGGAKLQQAFDREKTNSEYAESLARFYLMVAASKDLLSNYNNSVRLWKASATAPADASQAKEATAEQLLAMADKVYADLMDALGSADDATRLASWNRHKDAWMRAHAEMSDDRAAMSAWWTDTLSNAWRRRGTYHLTKIEARNAPWRERDRQPSREDLNQLAKAAQADEAEALRSYTEALNVAKDLNSDNETVIDNLISLARFWQYRQPSNREDKAEWLRQRSANRQEAKKFYRQATEADPYSYEPFLGLAELYIGMGETENALRTLAQRYDRGVRPEGADTRRNKVYMSVLRDDLFQIIMHFADQGQKVALLDKDDKPVMDDKGSPVMVKIPSLKTLQNEQAADLGEDDPRVLFMKASVALLAKDTSTAIPTLEKAANRVNMQSADPREKQLANRIQRHLADQYRATNQMGSARIALEKVRRQSPTDTRVLGLLAEAILAEGLNADGTIDPKAIDQAMPIAEFARQIDPDNDQGNLIQTLGVLARIYQAQKNFEQLTAVQAQINKLQRDQGLAGATAADKLQRAMILHLQSQSGDDTSEALKTEAEQLLKEVMVESPFNLAALRSLVAVYVEGNRFEAIKPLLDSRAEVATSFLSPTVATSQPSEEEKTRAQQYLAVIEQLRVVSDPNLSLDEKDQKLEELAAKSIEASSKPEEKFEGEIMLFQCLSRRASRAEQAKNTEAANKLNQEALAHLKNASQLRPDNKGVIDQLFTLALQQRNWAEAEDLTKRAAAVGLDPAGGAFYRGRMLFARATAEKSPALFEDAKRELESALTKFPSYSQGHFYYAWTLANLNRPLEAAREFDKALELDPRNAQAALGLLLLSAQRTGEDAEADKNRALEVCTRLIPNNPTVRSMNQGKKDKDDPVGSITTREKMLDADRKAGRKDLDNLATLARLHAQVGNSDRAKELYLEAVNTDPKDFNTPLDPGLLKLQIVFAYASFLKETRVAEVAEGVKLLDELRQAAAKDGSPAVQARAQIAYAKYLADLCLARIEGAPDLAAVDAEYLKAGEFAKDVPTVAMDTAAHFGNTALLENMDEKTTTERLAQAEKWARVAVSSAEAAKKTQEEQLARRVLVQALVAKRVANRNPALQAQLDQEVHTELNTYRGKNYTDNWDLYEESAYLVKTNRLEEALQLLQKYIGQQPKDPVPAHIRKAEIYLLHNQRKNAIEEYLKVKTIQPDAEESTFSVRIRLAKLYKDNDQTELAIGELESILTEQNASLVTVSETLRNLVQIYVNQKAWDKAERLVKAQYDKDPNNATWGGMLFQLYLVKGEPDLAMQYGIEAARKSGFDHDIVDTLLRGGLQTKQYDRIIRFINETLPPDLRGDPIYLARLGAAIAGKGDKAKAFTAFNQALDSAGDDVELFARLASDLKLALGKDAEVQAMDQRLAKNASHAGAKFARALLKEEGGDTAGAIAELQETLKILPADDKEQLLNRLAVMRAAALTHYKSGDYAKAKEQYESILGETRKYSVSGRLQDASVFAMNNLAYLLMDKLKNPNGALPYSRYAVKMNPNRANILDTLGWNLVLVGQTEQAIVTLRQAIKLSETRSSAIQYHLAEALFRLAEAQADPATKKLTLDEATNACREAYGIVKSQQSDSDGVLADILKLGEKLGLKLDPLNLGTPS